MLLSATPGMTETVVHWLLTPMSGSAEHDIAWSIAWHGRLMVLGLGVLMPPIVLIARFFKVTPAQDWPRQLDNPFWFVTHRRWGHVIGLLVAAGLVCVLGAQGLEQPWHSWHAGLGWTVVVLVCLQVVGSWLRGSHGGPIDPFTRQPRPPGQWPGDHFNMTRRRVLFEYMHKWAGYALIALTLTAIPSGLVVADAPRWMPITMGVWWLLIAGVFAFLQRSGRCIDTYQAIWGLDPNLPGNRRRPIGFGIERMKAGAGVKSE